MEPLTLSASRKDDLVGACHGVRNIARANFQRTGCARCVEPFYLLFGRYLPASPGKYTYVRFLRDHRARDQAAMA